MNKSTYPSYTVLKSKQPHSLPTNVTCFALNYVTHKLMVCNKEELYLYDLEKQSLVDSMAYAKKFEKLYDSEVRIRSIDAIIMSNLWVTFVNKKSFLFFNDKLEFSKIYSAEPNPALSLQILQRTNDIMTLRGDRRMLKLWRFEFTENVDGDKASQKKIEELDLINESSHASPNKQSANERKVPEYLKKLKADINYEKLKALANKGQSFEVNLYTRKNITTSANRSIMNVAFSEELNLIIVNLDNMDLVFYNIVNCDVMQTISFGTPAINDALNIPTLTLEQEILFYCDERRMVIYDLVLNEEIISYQHNLSSKVISIHAERISPDGGVYLVTEDEKLHVYSYANSKIGVS